LLLSSSDAFALTLPSLGNGLEIDDHLYRARVVSDGWGARDTALDSITYANPDRPAQVRHAMESGEQAAPAWLGGPLTPGIGNAQRRPTRQQMTPLLVPSPVSLSATRRSHSSRTSRSTRHSSTP